MLFRMLATGCDVDCGDKKLVAVAVVLLLQSTSMDVRLHACMHVAIYGYKIWGGWKLLDSHLYYHHPAACSRHHAHAPVRVL